MESAMYMLYMQGRKLHSICSQLALLYALSSFVLALLSLY